MTLLDTILQANRKFVQPNAFPPLPKNPKKQLAIFTCMDTRLVDFLEPAMGIRRGEAKVIKNAGNTIIDPFGGVIRSLVVAPGGHLPSDGAQSDRLIEAALVLRDGSSGHRCPPRGQRVAAPVGVLL